ncbi:MAG: crossover junction endodeoxyribonuclease RuvC [Candidatus Saccharibacteria bacterium]|nr:crossover junction endodeoxyribonuclease RuvC [Candidatus Saccharibacteria bacterium]
MVKTKPVSLKILGIDPGLETVGWGMISSDGQDHQCLAGGIISTSKDDVISRRLAIIHQRLLEIIDEFQPEIISMEKLFFFKNITSGIQVAQAQGVLMLACQQKNLEIVEYTPLQVKLTMTGYGRATKAQIKTEVQKALNLPDKIKNDNHADGLAVALTHSIKSYQAVVSKK